MSNVKWFNLSHTWYVSYACRTVAVNEYIRAELSALIYQLDDMVIHIQLGKLRNNILEGKILLGTRDVTKT